jgi:hypothetical protein
VHTTTDTTRRRLRATLVTAALGALVLATPAPTRTSAATAPGTFAVGVPTIVDPVRGAGEPDIVVDNNNNALITGPGGSGAQTSFFYRSRDGGLTYPVLGPSNGHWICPASGGGDSLGTIDRSNNDIYVTDQEALASLGLAKIAGTNPSQLTSSQCANPPGVGADRPFEAILNTGNTTAPQSNADGHKPIVYLSWACQGCAGGVQGSGLAFGWSDDGVTWHPADPAATGDNLLTDTAQEGAALAAFEWHGSMAADPVTGNVFTAISCNPGNGCPNGSGRNEIGVAIGVPQVAPTSATNLGKFSAVTYQTACAARAGCNSEGSLFPVIGMDSNRTLYEMWSEGNGFGSTTAALNADDWHVYYSYSLDSVGDNHMHTQWSAPIRVDKPTSDSGEPTNVQVATMGWMAVGDPGHLGFVFLGSSDRTHPSVKAPSRLWHAYMAVTTNGTSATPTFQQSQVGIGPNHIGDICLQGTVGCIQNSLPGSSSGGNRVMADFVSADIGPDGALQATWANDSNQLASKPSTLTPGLPVTTTARQVSGPRLVGGGNVLDGRFSTTPTTAGISDATGDGRFPVQGGTNAGQLDLTGSRVSFDGSKVVVQMSVVNAAGLGSPDTVQRNVWWLTSWQFNHKIYFAKAESDAGGALKCTAGPPSSFDRPGLNGQTVATLVDYSGGTAEADCALTGNTFTVKVPVADVGSPADQAVLESTTSFTVLDNGVPPAVGPGAANNIPTITDATPAYDALLSSPSATVPESTLSVGLVIAGAAVAAAALLNRRRRRFAG